MSNTWPPDWKNADNYKHVNEYTPSDICAWEFLRRNPEYQKDFAKYKKTRKSKNLPTPEEPYDFSDMCDWYGLDAKSKNFNPRIDTPPKFLTDEYPQFTTRGSGIPLGFRDEFRVILATDYDYDMQIDKVRKFFLEYRKKNIASRKRKSSYAEYLRILDARLDKATAKLILPVLHPGLIKIEKEIYDKTRKAKKLRDGGYIKIVKATITYPKPESS